MTDHQRCRRPTHQRASWLVKIRTVVFYAVMIICVILFSIWINALRLIPIAQKQSWQAKAVVNFTQLICFLIGKICRLRIHIQHLDHFANLIENGINKRVIICNHQSTLETFLLKHVFYPSKEVLKVELTRIPFFGSGLKADNPVTIDRSKPIQSRKKVLVDGLKAVQDGFNFVIYPEGTRNHPYKIAPYKAGAFELAINAEAHIVPIVHNIGHYWSVSSPWIFPGVATLIVGEPINAKGQDAKTLASATEHWALNHYPEQ